jgi:hypothetical protein
MTRLSAAELTAEELKARDKAFWGAVFGPLVCSGRTQPQELGKTAAEQRLDKVLLYIETEADKQLHWVLREPRQAVARVIEEVLRTREEAACRDNIITDPEIYLMFRKAAEIPMIEDEHERLPEVEALFILSALMNGDPKGSLPF